MKKTSKKVEENQEEVLEVKEVKETMIVDNIEQAETKDSKLNEELYNKWEKEQEKVFTNITKLKCDYTTYKEERTKYNMPVEEKCQKCGKKFKDGDKLYTAYIIDNDIKESCIICSKCANGGIENGRNKKNKHFSNKYNY